MQKKNSRITLAGGVALAALLALSGCGGVAGAALVPSAEPEATSAPETTDDTDDDADADAGSAGTDLTFEAGQNLPSSEKPQLGDPFVGHPGWVVRSSDDGQGSWSYTTADTLCTLIFMQQVITMPEAADGGATTQGDDESTTDIYLASVLKTTPENIGDLAVDGTFRNGLNPSAVVESRVVTGTYQDGYEWMISARAFAQPMAGLYAYVSCAPDADSAAVFADVVDHVSIFPALG